MLESAYQSRLIKRLNRRFPGIFIIKNDPHYLQGIPDLLLLYNYHWAMLEVKAYEGAEIQPNQEHYVNYFRSLSYGAFIYPENEEIIFRELAYTFQLGG